MLQHDLLMVENQLPYFILMELFKLTSKGQDNMSLEELIVIFFDPSSPRKDATSKLSRTLTVDGKKHQYTHMLNVFRSTFLKTVREKVKEHGWTLISTVHYHERHPTVLHGFFHACLPDSQSNHIESPRPPEKRLIYFALELHEVGIALKKQDCHDLLDITFKEGTLHISPLFIDNNSVPLFLNFVANDPCNEKAKPYFTNYFMFLDSLINSSNDVQIFHEEKILNRV
ncbi:hypothetical protein NL676_027110 [Syzygium grande]|nr:hypothetical protein NL676_027110 [Syzygium grande]